MPLNSLQAEEKRYISPGHLYIVATPIGNRDDITLRALAVLKHVDFVAAEDTRMTARLFALHQIKTRTVSYHEHNESARTPDLVRRLKEGQAGALVSDAGTPTISDPGYNLIRGCIAENIPVVPVPGVSAPAAALSVSGLPTDSFVFAGFLSKKKQKRAGQMAALAQDPRTLILYEAPGRVVELIEALMQVMGDRPAMLAREMTKLHEEFIRGRLSEILAVVSRRPDLKGECTLVIGGAEGQPSDMARIREEIKELMATTQVRPSDLSKIIAKRFDVPKKVVYDEILKLK